MSYQPRFWKRYFRYYDVLLKVIPYQELFKTIAISLRLKPDLKILDLGSGTGNLQYYLPKNSDVVSLDNSQEALEILSQKFPNTTVIKHAIQEPLPFEDNTFDRIVSNNVLYTLEKKEWKFVVSEIRRVSKLNSIIVISNLTKDFNALNIYRDHIGKSYRSIGFVKTLISLAKLVFPTIQMIRFNMVINRNNDIGRYSFLNADEQKEVFEANSLMSTQPTELVYSDQAFLNVFVNRKVGMATHNHINSPLEHYPHE